jgi:flavin-binding protein dodecin
LRKHIVEPGDTFAIIELVGTSTESWEKAAAAAIKRADGSLRDLRIAAHVANSNQWISMRIQLAAVLKTV